MLEDIASSKAEERRTALEKLSMLIQAVDDATQSEELEGDAIRSAYRNFARVFWAWYGSAEIIPTALDSQVLAQMTAQAIARVGNALSKKGEFVYTPDRSSIIHQPMNENTRTLEPLAVVIAPLDTKGEQRYFPPETIGEIHRKLLSIGSNLPAAFAIVMSCAIEFDRTFLDLDDFMKRLGLKPRSTKERKEYRLILWHSLQIVSQTSVVGPVTGSYKLESGNF